jgi:hypothetical protein
MAKSPLCYRMFRWAVFLAGDIRRLRSFPWVTWDASQHRIDYDEIMREAVPLLKPGDIVLHRDEGYLSDCFIPGTMIHAGIYVGDGYIIEAVSEGVKKRHVIHILHSDYAMIMRPQIGDEDSVVYKQATATAVNWALKLEGFEYDPVFNFNGTEARELIKSGKTKDARLKFACTETAYFCYLDYLGALNVGRRRNISLLTRVLSWFGVNVGDRVVDADAFVTGNLKLVWASRETTPQWADSMGCTDIFINKLLAYWEERLLYAK